jgi:glucokinase
MPGEGGHATLAPADDLKARCWPPCAASTPRVGRAAAVGHRPAGAAPGRGRRGRAQGPPSRCAAEEIVAAPALAGTDAMCSRTLDDFCALLGSFAGNVALTLGARGGVSTSAAASCRAWGERFFESRFRERFEAKGRFQAYLQAIPTR